jgi:hypothetical protein
MPFTVSHVVAVLPLRRSRLPTAALVAGSLSPDLPLFIPWPADTNYTHTLVGTVIADPIAGLFLLAVWHQLLRPAIPRMAPTELRRRIASRPAQAQGDRPQGIRGIVALWAGLVIGALTHVGWDAFTHHQLWGPTHLPWLNRQFGPLPWYEWAQHLSSLLGLIVLAFVAVSWWRRNTPKLPNQLAPAATETDRTAATTVLRRISVGLVSAAATAGAIFGIQAADTRHHNWIDIVAEAVLRSTSWAAVALLGVAAVLRLAIGRQPSIEG